MWNARFSLCVLTLTVAAGPKGSALAQARPPYAGEFGKYAVAADHPLASQAGAEVLGAGGNAVDAAVATSFALSVVRPFSCGIGGGGFMVVYLKEHPTLDIPAGGIRVAINYRETAPGAITPDFFEKLGEDDAAKEASFIGGKAVAIPGTVAGLLMALDKFGTMDRAKVLAPAIALAHEGFVADGAYAATARSTIAKFEKHPEWKRRFAFTWERLLGSGKIAEGDRIMLPEQADLLERIAHDGAKAFYEGPLAETMLKSLRSDGGVMTAEDLAGYRPAITEPLTFTFRSRTFLGMPPPSSGGLAMAEALGILASTDLNSHLDRGYSGVYVHYLTESFKHAFADRAEWLGDPAFVDVPVQRLLSPGYFTDCSSRIRLGRVSAPELYGSREHDNEPAPPPNDGGTSHLCVIDGTGNAVACTETINLEFGSLLSVHGFCLNDQMDDFTTRRGKPNEFGLVQSERNAPAPGKRPLSSMSPTIVLEGNDVTAVAGASGGPRIISATTQVLLSTMLFGKNSAEAVAAPRFHHQWSPNVLEFEHAAEGLIWQGVPLPIWMRNRDTK